MKLFYAITFLCCISSAANAQSYEIDAVNGTTINACDIQITDSDNCFGGNEYCSNEDYSVTVCSGTADPIRVNFTFYNMENGFDGVIVYDGPSTASPQIGTVTGFGWGDFFTSTGTCLTIRFISDNIINYDDPGYYGGFEAIFGCPPASCSGGNPPASDDCSSAPQICDLNGYCGNTGGWYTRGPESTNLEVSGGGPFCGATGSIENNSWISFVADATSATFDFTSSNCIDPSSGIQMQIYASPDCNNFTDVSNCVNQTTGSGTGTITATGLTVGQTYYIMVDGFAGNICDYTITANTGVDVVDITSSNGGVPVCPGQCVDLTVNATGASGYTWSSGGTGATETVCPASTTTYSVDVTGVCGGTETATFTVDVTNPTVDFHAEEPLGTIISPFPTTLSCTDNPTYLIANDSTTAGGYITPALHFVFISDGFATTDNTSVTIFEDGTAIWSQSPLNDNETLTVYGEYLSPSSNYTFQICDNFGDGGVDWEVYDGNTGTLLGSGSLVSGNPCETFGPFSPSGSATWTTTAPAGSFGTSDWGGALFDPGAAGPGTYDFTYCWDNTVGCSDCMTKTITVTNPYVATWSPPAALCTNDASINLNSYLDPTATAGGTWSGTGVSGNTFDPSVAGANTHNITYTVGGTAPCNATEMHSIVVNSNPTPTIVGDTEYCQGQTASISTQAYANYSWSNGALTQGTTFTSADNPITVTVTDGNGCVGTSPGFNVIENPNPTPTIVGDTEYCAGNTASISTQAYANYSWSNGALTQGTTVTNVDNPITVTVTDGNGCVGTSPGFNVTENPNPTPTIVGDTEYCQGQTASISTQAYSNYSWSNGALTQGTTVTNADNPITVTVTDGNGCVGTSPGFNVTENPNPTPTIVGDTEYCEGSSASVSTQVYANYSWSNFASTQSTTINSIDNPVTVTVTDGNGCVGTSPGYNVIENPTPNPTIVGDTEYCAGNTASISTQVYANYSWSNGALTQGTTVTSADSPVTVTVTDGNGCVGTSPGFNVTENPNPTPTIVGDTEYCEGSTASVSTQAYANYSWSNGALTQGTTVTDADSPVTVTVTDGNGCVGTSPGFAVTENPNPTPTIVGDTEYCAGNTASVSTQVYANYSWSNGALTQGTTVTDADSPVTVTVTDGNGCVGTSPGFNVTENPNPTPTVVGDSEYCEGSTASVSTQAFANYSWSNGALTQGTIVTSLDSPVTVTVTDANGCIGTSPGFAVTENPNPTPTIVGDTEYCVGGSASISTQVYANYSWSNGALTQGTTVTDADNPITVTVTDANGCVGTSPDYNVTENPNLSPIISGDTEYCAGSTASITTGAYSDYSWSNGATTQNTTVTVADNPITVTVTDANGCVGTSPDFNVTENPNPTPTISGDTEYCAGNTASITTGAFSDYNWSNGATTQNTTVTDVDNPVTVTVTDGNGCVGTSPGFSVTENPNPTPTIVGDSEYCEGSTASVSTQVYANYSWSNGALTQNTTVTSLDSPVTVTVTDGNGCVGTSPGFTVTENPNPTPTIVGDSEYCAGSTASISTQIYVDYSWSNGALTQGTTVTSLDSPVTVTVTDGNGCVGTSPSFTVTENPNPQIALSPTDPTVCDGTDGFITVNSVSGSILGDLSWTGTATGSDNAIGLPHDITGLSAGNYNVTFTDENGCVSVTETTVLTNPDAPILDAISDTSSCEIEFVIPDPTTYITGSNLSGNQAFYSATGGNAADELPQGTVITSAMSPMTVFVYDNSGTCDSEISFIVYVNEDPISTISPNPAEICEGSSLNLNGNPTGGSNTYTIHEWSGDVSILNATNVQSPSTLATTAFGNYNLSYTVTDDNGCSGTGNITVVIKQMPVLSGNQEICEEETTTISSTGTPDPTTPWASSDPSIATVDANGNVLGVSNGTVDITFLDANGCSEFITITVNVKPAITLIPNDPTTCDGTDGFITVDGLGSGTVDWSGDATGSEGAANLPYDITNLSAGNYNVIFTDPVTGCESDQVSTTLNNPGAPIIDPISDTSSCEVDFVIPDPATYITGTDLTGNQAFYSAPGGNAGDELTQGTVITSAMSPMTVYAFDNNGVCESETSFIVYVNENPLVSISPNPISVCSGENIQINGNPSGGSETYVSHEWTNTGAVYLDNQTIQNPIFNSNDVGNFDLTYTVEDDNGCSATETVVVTVLESTVIDPLAPIVACGEFELPAITGSNLSGSEAYYDDTQANGGQVVTGTITSSGTLYMYDSGASCSNEVMVEITINEIPEITTLLEDIEYCDYEVPEDIIFTVTGDADWNIEYTLNGVGETITSSQNNINLGNAPGVYNITLIEDNACSDTINVTFELIIKPSPPMPVAFENAEYCSTEELDSMRAESTGGTLTWYINEFEQLFGFGESALPENITGSTIYYITETVDGCESEPAEIIIEIIDCGITLSTAITPDGDGINDTWIIPNLDAAYPDNLVRVYNRWGSLIFEHDSSKDGPYNDKPWDGTINGQALPVGSYYFIIDYNNDARESTNGAISIILD